MKKLIAGLALMLATAPAFAQDYRNHFIQVGQKAPDLAFPNPAGETLKLSEITKDRVVLLDFWASWCGPCRRASPEIVALYNKYKDEKFAKAKAGFTIVSVSLDKDKAAWVAAISDDKLAWPYHISDLGFWNSQAARLYGIESIPQSMLIGPDGKILAKYNMGDNISGDLDKMLKKKG